MISGRIKCWKPKKEKLMMKEDYSIMNGALNILLSHITKELHASSAKHDYSYEII